MSELAINILYYEGEANIKVYEDKLLTKVGLNSDSTAHEKGMLSNKYLGFTRRDSKSSLNRNSNEKLLDVKNALKKQKSRMITYTNPIEVEQAIINLMRQEKDFEETWKSLSNDSLISENYIY